jgi:adenosylmethionine-8-amino-7-oxononanoate aminotransferase
MNLVQRDSLSVWHPFTPQKFHPQPLPILSAKDTMLYDESGKAYIDAISSWWVTLHGHGHPYIAEKIYEQALKLEQVIFAGFTHEPAVSLAERLLEIIPGQMSKVFYSDNGSTSTEVAIKMALQYWWNLEGKNTNRKKILCFSGSYHGDTFGAMSVSDRSVFTTAFKDLLFDVISVPLPNELNIGEIKSVIHREAAGIAAFIYEPLVQGAGGMRMYDASLLNELLNTAKLEGIICIADEVMTGFGRTGLLFASEYMHKKPDIVCLSKGLTGGVMALGVTACNDKIYHAFVSDDKYKTFFHGHSFTANPLACAAANASLDLLQTTETVDKIEEITKSIAALCLQVSEMPLYKKVKNLRQLGTILAFEYMSGNDGYMNSISLHITDKAMKAGVYLRPLGNTVYIMPPYCITKAELNKVFKVLELL